MLIDIGRSLRNSPDGWCACDRRCRTVFEQTVSVGSFIGSVAVLTANPYSQTPPPQSMHRVDRDAGELWTFPIL